MLEDIKIAENDKCIFYKNIMTKDFGDGCKIVMVEHKDNGYKEYLLIKNDKPIQSSQQIEDLWVKHDMIELHKKLS